MKQISILLLVVLLVGCKEKKLPTKPTPSWVDNVTMIKLPQGAIFMNDFDSIMDYFKNPFVQEVVYKNLRAKLENRTVIITYYQEHATADNVFISGFNTDSMYILDTISGIIHH